MPTETLEKITINEGQTAKKPSPRYKVLLHNDDGVAAELVVMVLQEVCQLSQTKSIAVMMEAHTTGVGLIKICDIEMAEFYVDGLMSKGVPASMEPEE